MWRVLHVGGEAGRYHPLAKLYTLYRILCWEERQAFASHYWLYILFKMSCLRRGRLLQVNGLTLHPVQNIMLEERQAFTSHYWLSFIPCSKCHVEERPIFFYKPLA